VSPGRLGIGSGVMLTPQVISYRFA
jgi:hypothetical protein